MLNAFFVDRSVALKYQFPAKHVYRIVHQFQQEFGTRFLVDGTMVEFVVPPESEERLRELVAEYCRIKDLKLEAVDFIYYLELRIFQFPSKYRKLTCAVKI